MVHQRMDLTRASCASRCDSKWHFITTKAHETHLLADVTGVNRYWLSQALTKRLLTLNLRAGRLCVADIMYWATRRQTTRKEDEAYCLLGLFGINMPLLYGEGNNAFFRL